MELRTYNVTVYLSSIRDFTLATRSSSISWNMAGFDTNLNYGTFRKRKENGHGSNFGGFRFRKYVERLKVYALAMNIKDKARKRALFLYCAGQKVQDIFDTLEDTNEDFKTAAEKLMGYFEPRKHHLFNIYQFWQLTQEKEESYDDFTTRLKLAAGPCDFPTDWRDVEIQLQLIERGKSRRVRPRLLSKPHTLTEALDFARAQEMSDKQAERIEIDRQSHGTDTNPEEKLYTLGQQAQNKTVGKMCFSCGGTFPHAGGRMKCPARAKKCLTCNKMNHFAKCCRMKGKENEGVLKAVEKDSDSSDAESLCGIEKVGSVKHNQDRRPVSSVTVENREFEVLVDTGATVNVMDEITFKRSLADKVTLRRSSSVLRAYQSNENPSAPLKVMGKFEAIVESITRIAPATFHVIKGHTNTEPLIGFQTAEDLGLVKVANTVQSEETITSNLLKEYADLFRGIGKMKGVKVDLHVDPAITPVAQAHRRIPFSVRPKLEAQLEKLEADDIIERVGKPTSWVPVVITLKRSSNEIRLNVDMREANKAVPRTHTVMPTLDDIINELNGATVFSHLDMNHGYHQLELKENSRDITTFATHVGLYRYKRLNFGTRSAGEIFQETVSKEITRDKVGCIKISDDILVFGRNQKEHDQNLEKLFKRAREKEITFNKDKCEFNKDKCLYHQWCSRKKGPPPIS